MINKHGLLVECAYNQLEKDTENIAKQHILDTKRKTNELLECFNTFLKNLKN